MAPTYTSSQQGIGVSGSATGGVECPFVEAGKGVCGCGGNYWGRRGASQCGGLEK